MFDDFALQYNQKSELQLLQWNCLLFLLMLNKPNIAVWNALDVLVIFFILVEWQYGHSIFLTFESPYNSSRFSNGYLGVKLVGIDFVSLIMSTKSQPSTSESEVLTLILPIAET